jgi:hypothetical protein
MCSDCHCQIAFLETQWQNARVQTLGYDPTIEHVDDAGSGGTCFYKGVSLVVYGTPTRWVDVYSITLTHLMDNPSADKAAGIASEIFEVWRFGSHGLTAESFTTTVSLWAMQSTDNFARLVYLAYGFPCASSRGWAGDPVIAATCQALSLMDEKYAPDSTIGIRVPGLPAVMGSNTAFELYFTGSHFQVVRSGAAPRHLRLPQPPPGFF